MADATILATQVGAYSKALAANTVYTVDVVPTNAVAYATVQIINHGTGSVFVKSGTTVTVDDGTADIIPAGSYIERNVEHKGATASIALISATAGTVSVSRSPRAHSIGSSSSGGGAASSVTLLAGTNYVGQVRLTDGTNNPSVKAASTAVVAADPALVVAPSPNTQFLVQVTGSNAGSFSLATAATTNATLVKSTAGNIHEVTVSNVTAATIYWKLYQKTSAPTVGTDVPILTVPVTAGGFVNIPFGPNGKRLSGIAFAVTGAAAATDTTAVGAGAQIHGTYS